MCSVVGIPSLILPSKVLECIVRFWAKGMMKIVKFFLRIDYVVSGRENIPQDAAFIVACKHQSVWETISLLDILHNPTFVLKHSLINVPIIGLFMKKLNMIAVNRGKKNKDFLYQSRATSHKKRPIVIFPEGTRTHPGQRTRYFRGVFALYNSLQVPVVPTALNSGVFWPRRCFMKKGGTITIAFLEPTVPGMDESTFMKDLADTIESHSEKLAAPYLQKK